MKKAVVTVIGKDRVGIIYNVSGILAENKVNILDISQTIMGDMFTMVMIVDIEESIKAFDELADNLDNKGAELGVKITICREDIFNAMHRI